MIRRGPDVLTLAGPDGPGCHAWILRVAEPSLGSVVAIRVEGGRHPEAVGSSTSDAPVELELDLAQASHLRDFLASVLANRRVAPEFGDGLGGVR